MSVALDPHMMTLSATARLGGGGGPTGIQVVKFLNPTTSTVVGLDDATQDPDLNNGHLLVAVAAKRTSGASAQPVPQTLPNETNSWTTIQASERYDTLGVSDGAGGVFSIEFSDARSYSTADDLGNVGHSIVGVILSGVDTISASLANNSEEGGANSPNLASITNGDTYDKLLITCVSGDDAEATYETDGTGFYTPSPAMTDYSAHHAYFSYRSDAFIAIIDPTTAGQTLAVSAPGSSYASSGWIIRAYGLTAL